MRSIKVSKYQSIISAAAIGICIWGIGLAGVSFADPPPEEEIISIETFYPSPWAEYNELHLYPHTEETQCNSAEREGLMYYDKDEHTVKVCRWTGSKYDWEKVSIGGGGGGGLTTYISASFPTCDNSTLGLMIFDTSSDRPYVCSANGVWKTAGWTDKDLVMAVHSSAQCAGSGGTIVDDGNGNKFCRFSSSACPSGWMQYSQWSQTTNVQFWYCNPQDYTDNTGGHSWSDTATECKSHMYRCGALNQCACSGSTCASVVSIGCY